MVDDDFGAFLHAQLIEPADMVDVAVGDEDAGDEGVMAGTIFLDAVVLVVAEIENDRGLPLVPEDIGIAFVSAVMEFDDACHDKRKGPCGP